MLKLNSLRSRLIAINLGLIIIGFGGLTIWAGLQMAAAERNDFGNGLQNDALSLATQLIEPLEDDLPQVDSIVAEVANSSENDVVLFLRDGSIRSMSADSTLGLEQITPYRIKDNQNGRSTFYASAPVVYETQTLGYVQLEAPASEVEETIRGRWLGLITAFLLFSGLGIVVTVWLLTSITRPLTHLRKAALNMADGDLSERVTDLPEDEIGAVGNAFNLMAGQVEAMVAEQRAFASNASHELRTPITTIQLRTEALKEDNIGQKLQEKYIDEIDSEIRHMGKLVEDLMMISRLDANRLEAGKEPIDAIRLLEILNRSHSKVATEKEISYSIETPEEPVIVMANGGHLQVVYKNILDNALKYTPNGGTVTAVLTQTAQHAHLVVTDTGEGISAEDLPNIGKRFYRADKSHSRLIPGTGLGLAMVQSIVKLYNGRFHIKSEGIGKGTAVTVEWPLYEA